MEPTEIDIYGYVMGELQGITTEKGYQDVAECSGVPKSTVKKIKRKEIVDPGVSHVQKLASLFRALESMPGDSQHEKFEAFLAARAARSEGGGAAEARA